MYTYLPANKTAGYAGYIVYSLGHIYRNAEMNYWMIPGTFFDDWDNQ